MRLSIIKNTKTITANKINKVVIWSWHEQKDIRKTLI